MTFGIPNHHSHAYTYHDLRYPSLEGFSLRLFLSPTSIHPPTHPTSTFPSITTYIPKHESSAAASSTSRATTLSLSLYHNPNPTANQKRRRKYLQGICNITDERGKKPMMGMGGCWEYAAAAASPNPAQRKVVPTTQLLKLRHTPAIKPRTRRPASSEYPTC
jgi:hypothetical protein